MFSNLPQPLFSKEGKLLPLEREVGRDFQAFDK
jgi:hypothetical protein